MARSRSSSSSPWGNDGGAGSTLFAAAAKRESKSTGAVPLAERMRPERIEDYVGQAHLVGRGKLLATAIEKDRVPSMILWGPPGVGKTTLARLMADAFDAEFMALSAVFSGVKDIRAAVEQAQRQLARGRTPLCRK